MHRYQRSNYQHSLDCRESKGIPGKKKKSTLFTKLKPLTVVDNKKLENSSRDGNTRTPYLSPEKPVCKLRSNN